VQIVNHHTFTGAAFSATCFTENIDHSSPLSQAGFSGVVVNCEIFKSFSKFAFLILHFAIFDDV